MSNLGALVADALDCLSECVRGPVRGAVTSLATSGSVVVPRGQLGTLPDGRVVRCTKATRVTTDGADVPVRLQFLAPSYPAANNFSAVGSGVTVTWTDPPTGLAATGTTVAPFAAHADTAPLVSLAELEHMPANVDPFAAGAQGTALAILLSPAVRAIPGSERMARYTQAEVTFKVRCNFSSLAPHAGRRTAARDTFDALAAAIGGAKIAGSIATIGSWQLVRQDAAATSYELTFAAKAWLRGRVMQSANAPTQTFDVFAHETSVNPTGQTPDEAVAEDIAIPSA